MKFPFVKFDKSDNALEIALRNSAPKTGFPTDLHGSIMRSVRGAKRDAFIQVSRFALFRRLLQIRWLPVSGVAVLALVGVWLALHHRAEPPAASSQSLPAISSAFTTGQEVVDALPSITVGPLSDELDKANQDLNRTAEFLLATLP